LQLHHFFTINSPTLHGQVSRSRVNLPPLANWPQGDFIMLCNLTKRIAVFAFASVCVFAATAHAVCGDMGGLHRQSWKGSHFDSASLLLVGEDHDPIVGMWHVTFAAKGNEVGPPDGAPIDNALISWHSDGTELMNSARPPQDGNFCMGVWKRTGHNQYKLNHFAWLANDSANAPSGIGNPAGPVRLYEEITLSPDGKSYTGNFTLDAYDATGNPVAHIVGTISATRIDLDTTVADLL
jgi:hypothetical protein